MSVLDTPNKRLGGTVPVEFEQEVPNCPQCGSWHTGIFRNPNIPQRFACVECDTVFTGLTGPEAKSHVSHDSSGESHRDTDDRDLTPYVRYASHPTDQAPELTPVDHPIPEDARFASPIYLLTEHQAERQADLDEPHAAKGNGCIAKALQDECENRNDVRYPIYVESDDLDSGGVSYTGVRDAIAAFIRDEIGVDPDDCRWFYSGSRSIHAHVPMFVRRGTGLSELRDAAEGFNADSRRSAHVDPGIYTRKRQFRLPGVEHGTTGGVKTPVDHRADDLTHELMDAMTRADGSKTDTFDDVLGMTFDVGDDGVLHSNGSSCIGEGTSVYARAHNAPGLPRVNLKETPLIERETRPTADQELQRWKQYNRTPFDPSRTSGRRSVCLARLKGGAFARDEGETLVPAYVVRAVSGPGNGSYTVVHENCPIVLSDDDHGPGDLVVIVRYPGQQDTEVFDVSQFGLNNDERRVWHNPGIAIAETMDPNTNPTDDARNAVIGLLRSWDAHVLEVEQTGTERHTTPADGGVVDHTNQVPTDAARLQERAEDGCVSDLSHQERLHVANHLLVKRGWDGALRWYRQQFGSCFKEDVTKKYLRSVAKGYSDLPDPPAH